MPNPQNPLQAFFQNDVKLSVDNVLVPVDDIMATLAEHGLDRLEGAGQRGFSVQPSPDVHGLTRATLRGCTQTGCASAMRNFPWRVMIWGRRFTVL